MSFLSRSQLTDPDRKRLEEYLLRFQENWSSENMNSLPAAFENYLPPEHDPLRPFVLFEVITMDMTSRWRIGQKVRIEFYLSAFPELLNNADRVVSLIYEEYRVRGLMQEPVAVNAFQERFPEHFDQFYRFVRSQVGSGETAITDTVKSTKGFAEKPTVPNEGQPPNKSDSRAFVPDFSRYEFVKRLGAGQFGEVWLAKAPGGVDVALKIIPWPSAHKMSQMELRALEVMKRLRHAFLIQVHAYWPMENQVAIVMELADGSMEDRLKEERAKGEMGIARNELIEFMFESAEALDHLHTQGVLHRDIKPANILIVENHAKLGDFGVARLVNAEPADVKGTCVGTPHFMAPEVWENKVVPASDQYSLAVTYVELRIGRTLFAAESLGELLRSHASGTPDLDPIPQDEQQILLKALSKKPEDRFESCLDFMQTLRDLVATEKRKEATKGEVRRRRIIIGSILGLAAIAAALPFFFVRPSKPLDPSLEMPNEIEVSAGGEEQLFFVTVIASEDDDRSIDLAKFNLEGLPDDINTEITLSEDEANRIELRIRANLDAQEMTYPVQVMLSFGDVDLASEFSLRVSLPSAVMPANTRPAPHATAIEIEDNIYWSHVILTLPNGKDTVGGLPIEFVLVPVTNPNDPATFYLMKNKVWNALFAEYWEVHRDLNLDESWRTIGLTESDYQAEDYPRRPVYRVAVEEAHRFATWLGGKLPTESQWDKAAGRFDRNSPKFANHSQGPYKGTWNRDAGGITVGGDLTVPTDVGTAIQDETGFGIFDMSGNGQEFTSQIRRHDAVIEEVPVDATGLGDRVITKGQDYKSSGPLQFGAGGVLKRGYRDYWFRSDIVSFRVMLPLQEAE